MKTRLEFPDEKMIVTYKGKEYDGQVGKVESVMFGPEDHGILTCYLGINFGGSYQGFGGYALDGYHKRWRKRTGKLTKEGKDWLKRACEVFDVKDIKDAKGKIVIALRDKPYDLIRGIKSPDFETGKIFAIEDYQKRWKFK